MPGNLLSNSILNVFGTVAASCSRWSDCYFAASDQRFQCSLRSEIPYKRNKSVISANRNFAVAYLLLVVIPILGLAGGLRSGSKLAAPTAIGGPWKMQVNTFHLAALPCAMSVATMRDVDFTISQSGKYF